MLQAQQVLQGRYQLQAKLGQNAGRQTWLATDIEASPPQQVIVKLLAFSPQMQWDEFKLFEREAQVLKNLDYPKIPQYRDYFSLDKQIGAGLCWFGLVQEYIPGASLQELLKQGKRFTEAQVRQIATEVLNILIYLHELSPPLLHRDIKPSNLIWGEDEQIYLVDFGAVQDSAVAEGVTFTVVGTTGYAPLEQFWGKAVPASDLYALGATLIHLLTGIAPADLPQKNLRIHFSDRVSLNSNFVRWIEAIAEPDLEQRYRTARQALEDLKANRSLNALLQQIRQPAGSRVQLWKSSTQLKIKIPGRGILLVKDILAFTGKLMLVATSIIALFLLGLVLLSLAFSIFYMLLSLLSSLPTMFLFIFSILLTLILGRLWMSLHNELWKIPADLKWPILNYWGDYCIEFYQDNFVIKRELFGLKYLSHRGKISSIKNVEAIPLEGVALETGLLKYCFAQNLTEPECNWIARQIQDWLR
ncbi:serine/threonine-protein kinase [Coleofasciculus sp. FACHB-SPT36]|uniref:serine/threonine protein kinase n=1 Tax=Cyanophyceae TaxID=3028117 RepID=UPI00168C0398|nr:serine/threonine-protein kinase [Coleofasciculus sp. FACHB-SPT36]MBD2540771.1 serine/threonine protein kinase [Coleofasciculus sp. FACHB-SPT36]